MRNIRVALVEDDGLIRTLTYNYLVKQPDLHCVVCTDSAEDLLAQLAYSLAPEVVLLDIGLPGMSGLDAIPRILAKVPGVQIMIQTVLDDDDNIHKALSLGATGYVLKGTLLPVLKEAIQEIVQGGVPFSPLVSRRVINHFRAAPRLRPRSLSAREQQVFDALVDGLTAKQVAGRLQLGVESVRGYVKAIYQKMRVHSRAELLNWVVRSEP